MSVIPLNPGTERMTKEGGYYSFSACSKRGSKRSDDLLKITQLVTGRGWI